MLCLLSCSAHRHGGKYLCLSFPAPRYSPRLPRLPEALSSNDKRVGCSNMTRALMFIGGLLLIVVAAALLYLSFADLSRYRPQVEALVSSALGRDFRITGELKLKALPNPSVVAEGVTLANAEWGAPTPMVTIGKVSAEVGLWSLLSGPIRIKWLELRDVAVLLEQNAAGQANWAFGADSQSKATAESRGIRLPVVVELASLENVDVLLRRPERDDFPVHANDRVANRRARRPRRKRKRLGGRASVHGRRHDRGRGTGWSPRQYRRVARRNDAAC